jgi:DNA repair protein RAD16
MEKLRIEVIDRILLRRTKTERHADLNLPPLEIKIRRDGLSAEEKDFYTSMYMQSRTKFDTYVDKGTVLHNYAHVFDLIMRLRQAVDHPYLIVHGSLKTSDSGPMPTQSRGDADVCALCQDDVDDPAQRVVAQCGHSFHRECVAEYLEQAPELPTGGIGCPACFSPLTVNLEEAGGEEADDIEPPPKAASSKRSMMHRIKAAEFKSSTKIEALVQEIDRMIAADSASKALVFSQFVNFLELIEWRLKREGISSAKLTGSLPIQARSNMIISFQTDPSLKVLLISLKAGGEGLNLQAADHVFVMDPWWNPAAELQAIQRAHRIGQVRPVKGIRFVASDTIEDKIIALQEKKQSVFDCTVGNSNQALDRLTAEDIQFLFNQ